jgi:YD repeat-containing protein
VVSTVMQVFDIITVCLSATPAAIVAIVLDVIAIIVNILITCLTDYSNSSTTGMFYNSDINGSNPLPSQFKRVEIRESSGTNGRTIMEFTSPDDYAIWEPTNPVLSMKQRFAPWAYGLPKKTTVLDVNGNKIKETENSYNYDYAKLTTLTWGAGHSFWETYPSCKYMVSYNSSKRSDDWTNPLNYKYPDTYVSTTNSSLLIDIYGILKGRVLLSSTTEKNYKTGTSSFLAVTNTYSYNDFFLPNVISTLNSDGSLKQEFITYNSYLADLMFLPSEVQTKWAPNSSTLGKQLKIVKTEYTYVSNGDIRPLRVLEKRFTAPDVPLNPPFIETQFFTYDAQSNLKGQKDESNRTVTNIYDYDDKYIVASVVNADPVNDICAYTSFETGSLGGFSSYGLRYTTLGKVTGKRALKLSSNGILYAILNTTWRYKFSFYHSGLQPVVSGAILQKTWYNGAGSTYYEFITVQGVNIVSVSGSSNPWGTGTLIDEVRLCPINSRMRSVTYDPIIGKTEECDENGNVTHYEYDALGRLRFVKDNQNNIVKMYEYNIAKKPVCPVTYSNLAVSETYTKKNCGAGYTGIQVTYTIPAGTYTSTFSQEAVDAMVENDLNTNGQNYANNNGYCLPVYYNAALTGSFTKEDCPLGYMGTNITYSVPAQKYSSLISPADANQQAQDEIDANGQAYANTPGNASCIISTEAVWEGTGSTRCVNSKIEYEVRDLNPNSTTYNQLQWVTSQDACVPDPCSFSGSSGFTSVTNNIYNNGTTAGGYYVFYATSITMQPGLSYTVATINGSCRPSVTRSINYTSSGRNWTIYFTNNGFLVWQLNSGPAVTPGTVISLSTFTYNL